MKKKPAQKKTEVDTYSTSSLFALVNILISLIVVGIVFVLLSLHLLDKIELGTIDVRFKLRGQTETSSEIVLVDIDEESLRHIGQWPWSREWHAGLITTLNEYKVNMIAFDIFFSDPNPLIDFFLIEATRMSDNVIYGLAFELGDNNFQSLPEKTNLPPELLARWTIPSSQIFGAKSNIPEMANIIPPLIDLYEAALGTGHVNALPDRDGVIRKIPAIINCNGSYYFHFAVAAVIKYLNINHENINIYLGKYIDFGENSIGKLRVPIDKSGFIWINWAAAWGKAFKHYPFWHVVGSYQQVLKNEQPLINLDDFKDKICLVGLTATGLIDIKPIPLEPAYPIVGLHANLINTILHKDFIKELQLPFNLLIVLILSVSIGFIIPKFRPIGGFVFTIIVMLLYSIIAYALFRFLGLIINITYPLAAIALNFVAVTIHSEVVTAIEKAQLYQLAIQDGLTKLYVVRHFKDIMQKEIIKSAQINQPLSVIISDIDHFKRINDTYGHLVGDFILKETANIFKSSCHENYIAGRYGGEEFIILLSDTKLQAAVEFAETLRKLIDKFSFEYNDLKLNVTISFGTAELKDETTPIELIKRADEALYVAKETGRNKVCFN